VDIKGASGATYRFMRYREGRPLSPAGGNFIFGRYTGARFEMLFAGEVQNLMKDARARWGEAVERYQASDLFTRLNISERVRQLEHADIVKANDPPMNDTPSRLSRVFSTIVDVASEEGAEASASDVSGDDAEDSLASARAGRAEKFSAAGHGERAADADPPPA
jgi:hypothetical protein